MLKITIKALEKKLGLNVTPNAKVLGFDTASRTGWCKITTDKKHATIDYGFVDIDTRDLYFKYNQCIDMFVSLVNDVDTVIIEETYFGRNVRVFQMLSRMGGFVYAICQLKQIANKYFVSAIQARKRLGLPCNVKKAVVHEIFATKYAFGIHDIDIIDAIILAFYGITKEGQLDI